MMAPMPSILPSLRMIFYLHSYVYACAHSYIHACMHAYMCMHVHMHACMHVRTYEQTFIHTDKHINTCTCIVFPYIQTQTIQITYQR